MTPLKTKMKKCCQECKAIDWYFDDESGILSCLECGLEYGPYTVKRKQPKQEKALTPDGKIKARCRQKAFNSKALPGDRGFLMNKNREISVATTFYNPSSLLVDSIKEKLKATNKAGIVKDVTAEYLGRQEVIPEHKLLPARIATLKRDIRRHIFKYNGFGLFRAFLRSTGNGSKALYSSAEKLYQKLITSKQKLTSDTVEQPVK